jgi:hypothetical protein
MLGSVEHRMAEGQVALTDSTCSRLEEAPIDRNQRLASSEPSIRSHRSTTQLEPILCSSSALVFAGSTRFPRTRRSDPE